MTSTSLSLNTGSSIPRVGLGLWKSKPGEVEDAVFNALANGVRLLDGAAGYENEKEVGAGIARAQAELAIPREDIFVVSKLFCTHHVWEDDTSRVQKSFDKTIADLGLEYIDLYLMHWPIAMEQTDLKAIGGARLKDGTPNPKLNMKFEFLDTWREMTKLVKDGKCRAIGVCNFTVAQLDELLQHFPSDPPCVNQCELHPYLSQTDLLGYCKEKGIVMMAYSPLGSGDSYSGKTFPLNGFGPFENPNAGTTLLQNDMVVFIAQRLGKSPAQVLIRWSVQRGCVCIPKSVKASRIKENADIFDWALSAEDVMQLDALDCGFRYGIGYLPGHYDCPNAPWYTPPGRKRPAEEVGPATSKKPAL